MKRQLICPHCQKEITEALIDDSLPDPRDAESSVEMLTRCPECEKRIWLCVYISLDVRAPNADEETMIQEHGWPRPLSR